MIDWRHTYKTPRLYILDARVSFFLLLDILHLRLWTIALTVLACSFLYYFEKRWDLSLVSSLRMIRFWMAGRTRPAQTGKYRRDAIDYDRLFTALYHDGEKK